MKSIDDLVEELDESLDEIRDYLHRGELAMMAISMARVEMIREEIKAQAKME